VPQGVQVRVLFPAPGVRERRLERGGPSAALGISQNGSSSSPVPGTSQTFSSPSYFSTWKGTLLVSVPLGVVTVT